MYHHLGRLVYERQRYAEAREFLLSDLEITVEFGDEHGLPATLFAFRRLWSDSHDDWMISDVASRLGWSENEPRAFFKKDE